MIELLVVGIVVWIGLCVLVLSLSAMAASAEHQGVADVSDAQLGPPRRRRARRVIAGEHAAR